ncbi:MAG TPA: putative 2-aminoethylphosphonate ABC transporter permease subunit [Casimicrobiaceae bacterium]|jgi:iron(III) transport system permease protein|nr:putative 2-aminoethylphosphonate ABC transporter permease subunit [Casimicrobiaceae bacterium]
MATVAAPPSSLQRVRLRADRNARLAQALLLAACALLTVFLLAPLAMILVKSTEDKSGAFVGLQLFREYATNPALLESAFNTIWVAATVTVITVPLAFAFAYALTRSCTPWKGAFRLIALVPILSPSMLAAISFIQWFGNQGALKSWLFGHQVYGPIGIIISAVYAIFPHALMIVLTSLLLADGRLYEAAESLGTSRLRKFLTITLPGARYGIVSAAMVVFSYTVSDFGIPKVIGGNFNVLAIDIFKQVIGQQNFNRGAVVSLVLLAPVVLAFLVEWWMQGRQQSQFSARAVPYVPRPSRAFDAAMFAYCALVCTVLLAVLGMAVYTSFIKLWPYDLHFSLRHYIFGLIDGGVIESYFNSLEMALVTAALGTAMVFGTAYLLEKTRGMPLVRTAIRFLATIPMAVPGMVLGLGYIFFFNHPDNPLHVMYGGMLILSISTIVHYYTSSHLTAVTALKSLDNEFEAVSASLKVPFYKTFVRVTVPVCLPAILDIARYLFINAMVTISGVVFLYSPDTKVASIAIINLDEAGEIGPAAAMSTLIVATSALICLVYAVVTRWLLARTQAWRRPAAT